MNDKLRRQEWETDFEYYQRIGLMKLDKEIDLEWDELAEICRIEESGTHWRKKMYGIREATEYYEEKINKLTEEYYLQVQQIRDKAEGEIEDKRLNELQNKILQLKVEKEKLKNERNHVNAQVRHIARVEHLIEETKSYINELNERKPLLGKEIIKEQRDKVGLCMISDIHLGVEVDNVLTQYSPQVCKDKMTYYVNEVIKYGEFHNINELYVLGLGDYVSGVIRNTNRYEARLNIVEQVITVSEMLSEAIDRLSKHFHCKVGIVQGNHDDIRMGDKDNHLVPESFTFFIDEFVHSRLKDNKNVEFLKNDDKEKEFITFEIFGYKFFASHGNRDKDKSLDKTIEMFECPIDFILRGHFHQSSLFCKNKTWVCTNGCFSGENYTKHSRLYAPPIQKFLIFNKDGLECNYDIKLDNYKEGE